MTLLNALLLERLRRDRARQDITEAILSRFDVVTSQRYCVRRREVYDAVIAALGLPPNNTTCQQVAAVCRELGAKSIVTMNRRLFARMRPAGMTDHEALKHAKTCRRDPRGRRLGLLKTIAPPPAAARPSAKELARLRREWDAKLRESGFVDLEGPGGSMVRINHRLTDPGRAAINAAYFDAAAALFWDLERDRQIWQLHALDGLDVREIARRLDLGRDLVHRTIVRYRGHLGLGRGDKHAEAEDDEGADPGA